MDKSASKMSSPLPLLKRVEPDDLRPNGIAGKHALRVVVFGERPASSDNDAAQIRQCEPGLIIVLGEAALDAHVDLLTELDPPKLAVLPVHNQIAAGRARHAGCEPIHTHCGTSQEVQWVSYAPASPTRECSRLDSIDRALQQAHVVFSLCPALAGTSPPRACSHLSSRLGGHQALVVSPHMSMPPGSQMHEKYELVVTWSIVDISPEGACKIHGKC